MSLSQATQLSWWHIIRLGLIQTALGGIVVLTTSTLNRIMVVELALAASLPGFLVTIHHIVQLARPRIGYGSDIGGRRTPWIIGGMFILAIGGVGAAFGTTLIPQNHWLGVGIAAVGFLRSVSAPAPRAPPYSRYWQSMLPQSASPQRRHWYGS